jgi:hypothetical protein
LPASLGVLVIHRCVRAEANALALQLDAKILPQGA